MKTLAKGGFFLICYSSLVPLACNLASGPEGILEQLRKGTRRKVHGTEKAMSLVEGVLPSTMTNPKKTILIIEDDLDVLAVMLKHLEHLGYGVITAADGMEGLKKLDSEHYDLVITDIVMPYVSGVGVVSAIKNKKPDIPVIAVTGYGKEPEAAAMEKNADMVLAKPVKISVLKDHIRELLMLAERKRES
jgi:CheY-like chemotaxis protein